LAVDHVGDVRSADEQAACQQRPSCAVSREQPISPPRAPTARRWRTGRCAPAKARCDDAGVSMRIAATSCAFVSAGLVLDHRAKG